jgi:hypothetical protein
MKLAEWYTFSMITKLVRLLAFIMALLSSIAVIGIIAAEMYVRWKVNLNFSFLGGDELTALIVSTFGLLVGLLFTERHVSADPE